MSEGHNIDLDWEKESDRDYIFLMEHQKDIEDEYYQSLSKNKKPAKITILTPIKEKKNEVSDNTLSF
jgi:hypothetical protein